jgi:hypothetical protein
MLACGDAREYRPDTRTLGTGNSMIGREGGDGPRESDIRLSDCRGRTGGRSATSYITEHLDALPFLPRSGQSLGAVPACGSGGRVPIPSRPACRAVESYGISYTTILSAMPRSAASF